MELMLDVNKNNKKQKKREKRIRPESKQKKDFFLNKKGILVERRKRPTQNFNQYLFEVPVEKSDVFTEENARKRLKVEESNEKAMPRRVINNIDTSDLKIGKASEQLLSSKMDIANLITFQRDYDQQLYKMKIAFLVN